MPRVFGLEYYAIEGARLTGKGSAMRASPLVLAGILLGAAWAAAAEAPEAVGSDAQFFSELGYKDVATVADAARAMTIFVSQGAEAGADFAAAREYLRGQGMSEKWLEEAQADELLQKGRLASLVCRALGIKGGLWMRLFGPLPRLALRECVYLELMIRGAEYQHVTGGELVGVIDRADRFRLQREGKEVPKLEGRPSGAGAEAEEQP